MYVPPLRQAYHLQFPALWTSLYFCAKCNKEFLFLRDVEEYDTLTGHDVQENIVIVWLDDLMRVYDFRLSVRFKLLLLIIQRTR
jgi:hypothetical protein